MESMTFSVVGSCVTRDASDVGEKPLSRPIHYFSRTRVQSIVSPPTSIDPDEIVLSSAFQRRVIYEDFRKDAVHTLRAIDHPIVIDLIDERFPLYKSESGVVTGSMYLFDSGVSADRLTKVAEDTELLADGPFAQAADAFAALLPVDQPIVVHRALWATHDADGALLEKPLLAARSNDWLNRAYDLLGEALGERGRFVAPDEAVRKADPNHKWGVAPFHYVSPYYDDLADQVRQVLA